jgi:hypothetical protein
MGFLTIAGERRVSGREHGKLNVMMRNLSWRLFVDAFGPELAGEPARSAVNWGGWVLPYDEGFSRRAHTTMAVESGRITVNSPEGGARVANAYETGINSVCAAYPDPVALCVRMLGQCEVNGWVAGEHRGWLADLLEQGMRWSFPDDALEPDIEWVRRYALLSDEPDRRSHYDGWASVIAFLRERDDSAVVLDYSVTDGFPDRAWAAWPGVPGARFRRWWAQASDEQQWRASERGLRARTVESPSRQITPENLRDPGFGGSEAWTWRELADAWRARNVVPAG